MSNTKTYTFTKDQLLELFFHAARRRDDEIFHESSRLGVPCPWLGQISSWDEFAEDCVNRLDAGPLAEETESEDKGSDMPPSDEQEEEGPTKVAGYISSRSVDKLQFNIDTLKLGNLPGCYKMVKEEGGFFKALSDSWNAGEWLENEPIEGGDDTPCSFLGDMHCCEDTFWVNPKYANTKMSDLGEIGCREVAMDGTTAISIMVYYKKSDGTVIAYDLNAC